MRGKQAGTKVHVILVPKGMEKSPIFHPFPKLKPRPEIPLLPILAPIGKIFERALNVMPAIFINVPGLAPERINQETTVH